MRKILILGGSGFVGSAIMKKLSGRYDVYVIYCHNSVGMNDNKSIKFDDCKAA